LRRFLVVAVGILLNAGQAFGNPTGVPLNLEQMARRRFTTPSLSEAEKRVVQHASDGTVADCTNLGGGRNPATADGTLGARYEKWPETRNVRADLIRWLLIDREARELIDPRGILILGARITGALDLGSTNVLVPLFLVGCRLEQPLNLLGAKMTTMSLEGSWTGAIAADGLRLDNAIFLRNGFHAEGEVRLVGATIGGILDAEGGTFRNFNGMALNADSIKVTGSVFLENGFTAEGEVWLPDAIIEGDLLAEGGTFKNLRGDALNAERIKVTGSVFLRNGLSAEGGVKLLGATIGGDLDALGGTFRGLKSDKNPNSSGYALAADDAKVSGGVFLRNVLCDGEVRLIGAVIGGDLDAEGGRFENSNGHALSADAIKVTRNVLLANGFSAEGEVRLPGATIDGQLSAVGGTFKNPSGNALAADGINVRGGIFLGNGFSAEGGVRLPNATIGSSLDAGGGTFKNPSGDALNADGIKVVSSVFLRNGFRAEGETRLLGATIGGDLDAGGGTFKNLKSDKNPHSTEHALSADRIEVNGHIFLTSGFSAEGEVRLPNATIGGNLEATGGTFKNPSGNALIADRIEVSGNVFLRDKFLAEGTLRLLDAEIKGELEVDDAWLDELNLESARVTGGFVWRKIVIRSWWNGSHPLDLYGAKVGTLADEEASWPKKGGLILDGFVYDRIAQGPTDAKTRLQWLALQDGYHPQPYEQLIAVLRQMGLGDQVEEVAIAEQWNLRKQGHLDPWSWIKNWFLYLVVGYGYRAWLAFIWLSALVLFGRYVYSNAYSATMLVPSDEEVYEKSKSEKLLRSILPSTHFSIRLMSCSPSTLAKRLIGV
jgi:sRNA-binding regulator protein Hfq